MATLSYYNWPLKLALFRAKNTINTARIERVSHDQVIPLPAQSKGAPKKSAGASNKTLLSEYDNFDQILKDLRPDVVTPQSAIKTSQRLLALIFDLKFWTLMQEKDGVEIYTLSFEDLALPMVRGEAYITGIGTRNR